MTAAIFELDTIKTLPLWAQVLIASRLCRRGAMWLALDASPDTRAILLAGCDAVDRCALLGQRPQAEIVTIEHAVRLVPTRETQPALGAMYFTADAATAAESALDFAAAESACTQSVLKAMNSIALQPPFSPIQLRIFAAADLSQLRFACKENKIGRYDALGAAVFARLVHIIAPDPQDFRHASTIDPQVDCS